jgi:hypothetical protein
MKERIRELRRTFRKLWDNMVPLAKKVISRGGHVAVEWPRKCEYWDEPVVQEFFSSGKWYKSELDGCIVWMHCMGFVPSRGMSRTEP